MKKMSITLTIVFVIASNALAQEVQYLSDNWGNSFDQIQVQEKNYATTPQGQPVNIFARCKTGTNGFGVEFDIIWTLSNTTFIDYSHVIFIIDGTEYGNGVYSMPANSPAVQYTELLLSSASSDLFFRFLNAKSISYVFPDIKGSFSDSQLTTIKVLLSTWMKEHSDQMGNP